MAIVQPGSGDVPEVAPGLYTFRIIDTEQDVRQDSDFGKAGDPILKIYCELADVADDEGAPIVLRPIVALKFSQGGKYQPSTLYLYAKAAGVLPKEGQPFDTDLLEGRVLQGMVQQEEGKWPRIEPKSLMPVKAVKGQPVGLDTAELNRRIDAQKAADTPPWEGEIVASDLVSTWWKERLDEGFQRKAIVDLCKEMFSGRVPGELNAEELQGLTSELLITA